MKITVYSYKAEEVQKRLDKIAKKAARYSIPFSYTMSEEHPQDVEVKVLDPVEHCWYVDSVYTVAAVDFNIDCEGLIKQDGWTVCAQIEHGEDGNIVTGYNNYEIPVVWYNAPARCDHCHTNRARSVTYMVRNESGEIRQVGKSCLHDYTGIHPSSAALWAEVTAMEDKSLLCIDRDEWDTVYRKQRMFYVRDILACAVDSITKDGYRKADDRNATKDVVIESVQGRYNPTEAGYARADEIIAWALERAEKDKADRAELDALYLASTGHTEDWTQQWIEDEEALSEYNKRYREINCRWDAVDGIERDCFALIKSGYAKIKHIGRLAYLPVYYSKFLERKAKAEQRDANNARSQHVGQIGERIRFTVAEAATITSWDTEWGTTWLEKIVDADGNVFMWKTSKCCQIKPGNVVTGTIKDHSEYEGMKQTVLTRCKIA